MKFVPLTLPVIDLSDETHNQPRPTLYGGLERLHTGHAFYGIDGELQVVSPFGASRRWAGRASSVRLKLTDRDSVTIDYDKVIALPGYDLAPVTYDVESIVQQQESVAYFGENLLQNPGFEELEDGIPRKWEAGGDEGWPSGKTSLTMEEIRSGPLGLDLRVNGTGRSFVTQKVVLPEPGKKYELAAWVKRQLPSNTRADTIDASTVGLSVKLYRNGEGLVETHNKEWHYSSDDWEQLTLQVETTSDVDEALITLSVDGKMSGISRAYFDDISFRPEVPAVSENEKIVLVEEGKPQFVIVTAPFTTKPINEAVEELNYWVRRITGTTLPVVSDRNWDGVTPYIAVGRSSLTTKNGWDQGKLRQEEARIFIEPERIGLLGNDNAPYDGVTWKGTYYAVLEFVRKQLGVRWIWPGELGEVFEQRSTLVVSPGAWTWEPDLPLMRLLGNGNNNRTIINRTEKLFGSIGQNPEIRQAIDKLTSEQSVWINRQRMNRSTDVRFGHSFPDWWDRYGKDHPDWFARPPAGGTQFGGRGVQLNLSNPEVHDALFRQWKQAWDRNPWQNKILTIGPNDSRGYDTRLEARAWDHPEMGRFSAQEIFSSPEPNLTDRHLKFWNIIARRIKEVDPEAKVTTYAYRNYQAPPLGDEQVEDNILIAYVGGEGNYPDEPHLRQEWLGWKEKGAQLLWRPNMFHTGHGTPYLFSKALYEDFRFFRENGMLGTHFDSITGNWAGQGLAYYVLAEQHSRPDASYEELAKEYFDAFGPAADPIRAFHEYFEQQSAKIPELIRRENLAPRQTWGDWWIAYIRVIPRFLTPEVVRHAETLLSEARESVRDAEPIYTRRLEVIETGFMHAKIMAESFGKIRLDDPSVRISYHDPEVRQALQPLWDFRIAAATNYLIPFMRYLTQEEMRLGIWSAFRISTAPDPSIEVTSAHLKLNEGWVLREDHADPKVTWHHLEFNVPVQADTGERSFLEFDHFPAGAKIWLNGVLLFEGQGNEPGDGGDGQYRIDVSTVIKDGDTNILDIRMEQGAAPIQIEKAISLRIQRS